MYNEHSTLLNYDTLKPKVSSCQGIQLSKGSPQMLAILLEPRPLVQCPILPWEQAEFIQSGHCALFLPVPLLFAQH